MDFQNQNDLQVEKILDKKVFNGKTLYLVKWRNYPIQQATWECNKLLVNVKDKIRQFKYSKKAIEQIPNIKFEEDLPQREVRDTFKRKRGRPPRLSFNSYRQAANQPAQKQFQFHKTAENVIKRGRGRPRGSKNKRPRHIHFQEQSQATFDSESLEKSRFQDRTLTNQDSLNNQSRENESKKHKKLRKLILKTKQNNKNLDIKYEKEQQLDIVDSQDQVDQGQINFNSGQKLGCTSRVLIDLQEIFTQRNEINEGEKQTKNFPQQANSLKQKLNSLFENGQLESNQQNFIGKKQTMRRNLNNQRSLKNIGTISSQKQLRRIFVKQKKQQQKDFLEQLDQFQQKHFMQQTINKIVQKKPNQEIKSLKKIDQVKDLQNTNVVNQTSKKSKQNELKSFSQRQQESKLKQGKKNIQKKSNVKKLPQITKIYHLQTIQLCLNNLIGLKVNQEFRQLEYGSFSEQQLKKMSLTRQITDTFSNFMHLKKGQMNNKYCQQNNIDKSKIIYETIRQIVQNNPDKDNNQVIDNLRQIFLLANVKENRPNLKIIQFQEKVQEILYLVQFDQGKIIKKMTNSEIILYLMIDMIKSARILDENLCFGTLLNFTFYIKFLEKSPLSVPTKIQPQTKIQKSTRKNIKTEDKNISYKPQLQDLLIEALKNIKVKPDLYRSNVFQQKKQKKKKSFINQDHESNIFFTQNQIYENLFPEAQQLNKTTKVEEEQMEQLSENQI